MSCINNNSISTSIHQSLHTLHCISCHTDTCCYTQAALAILTSHRFVLSFCNILVCNQANQLTFFVHYRQLFNLVFLQDLCSSFHICTLVSSNDVILAHHLIDMLVHIKFETEVTVSHNTNQIVFIIYHRNTTNMIFSHQIQSILNGRATLDCYRIVNHTIFGTLYNRYLTSLFFN